MKCFLSLPAIALFTLACARVAVAAGPNDVLPEAPGKALVVKACTSCHQAPQIVTKRYTADEWDELLAKMVARGAPLTESEQDQVFDYLIAQFGAEPQSAVR